MGLINSFILKMKALDASSLRLERYDQSTYLGRFRKFIDVTDARTLLASKSEVASATATLREFERRRAAGLTPLISQQELWKAKKLNSAVIHPDTGETIPLPFRMSAFVPMNILICYFLVLPNPTMKSTIFWQWFNQSYNVAVNHCNRNASNPVDNAVLARAYTAACTSSVAIALAGNEIVKRSSHLKPALRTFIRLSVPYTAVATAGVVNVVSMRYSGVQRGIAVTDADGNVLGDSKVAGKMAVQQEAASRAVLSFPCAFDARRLKSGSACFRARQISALAIQLVFYYRLLGSRFAGSNWLVSTRMCSSR